MAISLYSGFVGSGKSFHAVAQGASIADAPAGKRWVVANFPLMPKKRFMSFLYKDEKKYRKSRWIYKTNDELTPEFLIKKSVEMGWDKKESSVLLIFDEASIPFNSRDWQANNRKDWIQFLTQSRKFGYDVIFITQDARMLDRQIRSLCEYETTHRKLNNWGFFKLLPRPTIFAGISYWNGISSRQSKGSLSLTIYRKSIAERYDTKALFGFGDDIIAQADKGQTDSEARDAEPTDGEGGPATAGGSLPPDDSASALPAVVTRLTATIQQKAKPFKSRIGSLFFEEDKKDADS